ncbi:hypothetical protein [Oenococcus sicerae]|uniref:Uncharacterized protein n=1 Tax=Oenococcus sicerae TaxID=2203724 RepID=A0AAJ1VNR5_9LACO|nr:hypothetical protein [Oenococcus sicerae]MDN6900099.1 hypothetical protein [Oenococcus sicerae]
MKLTAVLHRIIIGKKDQKTVTAGKAPAQEINPVSSAPAIPSSTAAINISEADYPKQQRTFVEDPNEIAALNQPTNDQFHTHRAQSPTIDVTELTDKIARLNQNQRLVVENLIDQLNQSQAALAAVQSAEPVLTKAAASSLPSLSGKVASSGPVLTKTDASSIGPSPAAPSVSEMISDFAKETALSQANTSSYAEQAENQDYQAPETDSQLDQARYQILSLIKDPKSIDQISVLIADEFS